MNLLQDTWIPVVRANGAADIIAPRQIAEKTNPVVEIQTPRPDFQGALYQFLIGLLQTASAPEDHEAWLDSWDQPPGTDELEKRFACLEKAFFLKDAVGPLFMQDLAMGKGEPKKISSLLIDAPGGKTVKDNLDHFNKRDTVRQLCPSCCATALFTLQVNAPSGGVGHRVGLRGGGPLTTLVLPARKTTLWQKLWLNVLDQESFTPSPTAPGADVFPWMGSIRLSDRAGTETRPKHTHPLQMYWAMPRRIKLHFSQGSKSICDICGSEGRVAAKGFLTQNYGINYTGEWLHPLTPYRFDKKKEKPPISLKGQQGGLGYRHWLGLVLSDPFNDTSAAQVTRRFIERRAVDLDEQHFARLWCFGYDMDNMKARCWYDHTLPLFYLDQEQQANILAWASELINAAREAAAALRRQVKSAWFKRPEDAKGDMNTVVYEFWQQTETDFYRLVGVLAKLPGEEEQAPAQIYTDWYNLIRKSTLNLFDAWALAMTPDTLDMKRVIAARDALIRQFNISKAIKTIKAKTRAEEETA